MRPYLRRATPQATGIVCYVCGQAGGAPHQRAILARCGYAIESHNPHAHPACVTRAISAHRQREFEQAQRQRNAELVASVLRSGSKQGA